LGDCTRVCEFVGSLELLLLFGLPDSGVWFADSLQKINKKNLQGKKGKGTGRFLFAPAHWSLKLLAGATCWREQKGKTRMGF